MFRLGTEFEEVGENHTVREGLVVLLTTDHPLYAEVVRQLTVAVSSHAIQQLMDAFGIPPSGEIVPITESEYDRAFMGLGKAGCADIVVGAAVADMALQSVQQALQSPLEGDQEVQEPAMLPGFGTAVDLFKMVVGKEFEVAKQQYDRLPGVVPLRVCEPQVLLSPDQPYYAGMQRVHDGVVVEGRACYQVDEEAGIVRVVYPVDNLAAEQLPLSTLFADQRFTYDGGYYAAMRVLYGASHRQVVRRVVAVLQDGPTMVVGSKGTKARPSEVRISVSRVGAARVVFDQDDVAMVTTGVGDFVDCLDHHEVVPRVFRADGYYPRGAHNYVFAGGAFAQGPWEASWVSALAFSLRRIRNVVVVVPGDAELEVVLCGWVHQSVAGIHRELARASVHLEVLADLLGTVVSEGNNRVRPVAQVRGRRRGRGHLGFP